MMCSAFRFEGRYKPNHFVNRFDTVNISFGPKTELKHLLLQLIGSTPSLLLSNWPKNVFYLHSKPFF